MKRNLIISVFVLLFSSLLFSKEEEKKSILIFDFQNISKSEKFEYLKQSIPDSMSTSFIQEGEFNTIRRDVWLKIVKQLDIDIERGFDEDQALAIGRALRTDAVIYGSFFIVGNFIRINAKAINIYTGKIITGIQVQGETGLDVFDLVDKVTKNITGEVKKEFVHLAEMKDAGKSWVGSVMRSSVLPGWGQLYNKQPIKSYIIWGLGVGLLSSTITTYIYYTEAKKEYDALQVVSQSVYDEKYDKMNDYYQYRKYSLYAFLGYYAVNIIDAGIFGAVKYSERSKISFYIPDNENIQIAFNYKW